MMRGDKHGRAKQVGAELWYGQQSSPARHLEIAGEHDLEGAELHNYGKAQIVGLVQKAGDKRPRIPSDLNCPEIRLRSRKSSGTGKP